MSNPTANNAKTITVDHARQIYADLNVEEPTATTYHPNFRTDVAVVGLGTNTPVNENYCLTIPSALDLMIILADLDPIGYMSAPAEMAQGSTFQYTSKVPWLQFSNGAVRNAGTMAVYWKANSGDPGGNTAEANARMDIAWG